MTSTASGPPSDRSSGGEPGPAAGWLGLLDIRPAHAAIERQHARSTTPPLGFWAVVPRATGRPVLATVGAALVPTLQLGAAATLVSLLIASAIVSLSVGDDQNDALRIIIALAAVAVIAAAVYISKQREVSLGDDVPPAPPAAPPTTQVDPSPTVQM